MTCCKECKKMNGNGYTPRIGEEIVYYVCSNPSCECHHKHQSFEEAKGDITPEGRRAFCECGKELFREPEDWEKEFWDRYADKSTLTYKWTNPLAMFSFICHLLNLERQKDRSALLEAIEKLEKDHAEDCAMSSENLEIRKYGCDCGFQIYNMALHVVINLLNGHTE